MTLPRDVIPGRIYMFTRRCTQRQFLMRPDPETNNAYIYCLAVAANRFGIQVFCTMPESNHHHTNARDVEGKYPEFLELFHKLFAKCQNSLHGRWENFWASEQPSVVRLESPEDVMDKMVYALSNPAKDHLVEKASDWPGASSLQANLSGMELTAYRPKHFFREDGAMPEKVTLKLYRPPGFEHLTQEQFAALLMERIAKVERKAREERRGGRVLGVKAILRQRPTDRPETQEPRRALNPRIAAKSKWQRIEATLRNKVFQLAYAKAREAFSWGLGNVMFPEGTYWLRRFAGVLVPLPAQ
jgi:putative transposase